MALYYKEKGLTLSRALGALYARYGFFSEKLLSLDMPGQSGRQRTETLLADLKANYRKILSGEELAAFEDYETSVRKLESTGEDTPITLPKSDVLKFLFKDGSFLAIRPSHTEPKIKIYLSAVGENREASEERLKTLQTLSHSIIDA